MRRLFICDPVCIQPFGHNLTSLKYYAEYFKGDFDQCIQIAAAQLPTRNVSDSQVVRFFQFYYNEFVPFLPNGDDPVYLSSDRHKRRIELSRTDFARLLSEFNVGEDDSIFLPSVDYYGLLALIELEGEIANRGYPRIYLRFIGVMENASTRYSRTLDQLLSRLRHILDGPSRIALSAETSVYSDVLAAKLQAPVYVTPYPGTSELIPLPEECAGFTIASPGSAREDKGFFKLEELFRAVRRQDPSLRIRFLAQSLPDRDAGRNLDYLVRLQAIPGTEILAGSLSEVEIQEIYAKANLVILPYDPGVYRWRGSAVMMESVFLGRPVIALAGTAFSQQIGAYNMGLVCQDIGEMASKIVEFSYVPRVVMQARVLQSRVRFSVDVDASYRAWMDSL